MRRARPSGGKASRSGEQKSSIWPSSSSQLVLKSGMSQSSTRLYEFGAFRLDAVERVLWRGEEMIVLPPKVFDTLWMLVKEEGRVVSKSELMEAIWANAFVKKAICRKTFTRCGARSALTSMGDSLSKQSRAEAI